MAYSARSALCIKGSSRAIQDAGIFKQERFIHSPAGGRHRGRVSRRRAPAERSSTCAPTTTSGCPAIPRSSRPPTRGSRPRGYGMSSVRFICGTQDIHRELEQRLTEFLGTEDTLLFPSCMDANAGVFEAILTKDDVMISDRLVHASLDRRHPPLQRHARHLQALRHGPPGGEAAAPRRQAPASSSSRTASSPWTATRPSWTRWSPLCEKYDAMLLVDDSHASGFIGKTGRGTHEKCGVMGKIDVITTTFGKALGGASGGCVSGRSELVEMCRQRARPVPLLQHHRPRRCRRRPQGHGPRARTISAREAPASGRRLAATRACSCMCRMVV